ncbi:MAG: NfeD family protein [Hydrocarboniphaga sp.]|uniref:NfeD family protein n=1 Tax=Hydrocarboniphaga sp. TaxID=2033016 RepID=UPI002613F88C|nr:NfeD family protein [Hydrocarboniphaga sp.]MDB5972030.1 NfeD family protein [Hydrocarboniphaga sp.]
MDFTHVLYWHWWIAGFALLALEALAPGAVFLWMGISALVVGAIVGLIDFRWEWQVMLFALLSLLSFFAFKHFRREPLASEESTLNRRGHSYVGRTFTLSAPIVNGIGKLSVDDSQWRISGADAPAGCTVRVTRADGVTLHVERLN